MNLTNEWPKCQCVETFSCAWRKFPSAYEDSNAEWYPTMPRVRLKTSPILFRAWAISLSGPQKGLVRPDGHSPILCSADVLIKEKPYTRFLAVPTGYCYSRYPDRKQEA
ncbi:unnamed protein product [Periconia digitata]|uniref:Uncharacterized protein n=1 Tax=Periconia digitata TaxID=1303443 RepID=A0A9W4U7C0_9PLEO|nr:unnamed protein product [Periconia digitata]